MDRQVLGLDVEENRWLAHFHMFSISTLYKIGSRWVTNIPSDPRMFKTKRAAYNACCDYASALSRKRSDWYRQPGN